MVWVWVTAALASGLSPMVVVDWSGREAALEVWPPLGVEVAEDAPVTVEMAWGDRSVRWEALGAALDGGVPLGDVRDRALTGQLTLSLCEKATGTCAKRDFALEGYTTERRRGRAVLQVADAVARPAAHAEVHGPSYQTDAAAIAEAAFQAARDDGKRVLLDFGAVWCPPCNLLSAEVLHAATPPDELDAVHIAVLDVDDPRSFELKSRYDIGGYPTLIVVDAEGTEISRTVGYPGRREFLDWLARAAAQEAPDTDFSSVDPASVEPERAAEIAWLLVQGGGGDPEPWIARAGDLPASRELRLARVSVEPGLDDARWLASNAPGTAIDWVYPAKDLAKTDEGRAVLRSALQADLAGVRGSDAADLLYLLAETAAEADQPLLYAAAAAALRSALTGEPVRDKGHYTWLAVLMERSGDVDGAVAFLEEQGARFADEPTFHLALASTHLRNERPAESLVAAEVALERSWGDNKLRAAEAVCKALGALDRGDEAQQRAKAVLSELAAPGEDVKVRTHRYRERLQAWADGTADKED